MVRVSKLRESIVIRLVLAYGLLVSVSILVMSAVFYFGTIGVLDRGIDATITGISHRLVTTYGTRPVDELVRDIARQMVDGVDTDSEIFLLTGSDGRRLAGNIPAWPGPPAPLMQLVELDIVRHAKSVPARFVVQALPNGARLYVGRDLREQQSIRDLVWTALGFGTAMSLAFMVAGAMLFRRQIEARIGHIRRIALEIQGGDLSQRIPVSNEDEFGLLNRDINRMLDRIEHLMEGVRHVSNAIAHDLRTPLGRVRNKLEGALRNANTDQLSGIARSAIADIDELILVFEKLLQIAEAESGMRPTSFEAVDLNRIVHDIVELYDATAEESGVQLKAAYQEGALAVGDRNLLGSALASLIDNAIRYAGAGATVEVGAFLDAGGVALEVRDDGPGIPVAELPNLTKRFYRLDRSRHLPGNGLGLAIVAAVVTLHGGTLNLGNGVRGFVARIVLRPASAGQAA